jgi:opacity protein-like surface antigen/outer membrane receptor protein involved in Fe transport
MRWAYRGMLLGGSALAAVSMADRVFAQDQSASPSVPPPQTPAPAPPPAETPPSAKPSGTGTILPTITVVAPRPKPKPKPAIGQPATGAESTGQTGQAGPPVPAASASYQTGAPNTAGGTPATPQLASQMTVSGADINARPITRPGEVVEAAPGLAAIDHSDGGKANQYYLRGWNLDHGTDFATFVDDMPINLPSNVHGQGYTDLNWLIPEAINGVEIRKGPYFADVGDFQNAGNLHVSLRDSVDQNIAGVTAGSFGYLRYFALGSTKVDGGGNLLYAGELNTYNGPWTTPDDVRKFSGIVRYSQGTATDGLSVTAAAYTNTWNAADQIPLRAVATGQIGLYGELDPTDGGDSSRFSLSARVAQSDSDGLWKANVSFVRYTLDLYNNFTWDTVDPTNGDQFHQHENRFYTGAGVSRTINGTLAGLPTETVFGLQVRYDDITNGLSDTVQRQFLTNTLLDHVNEGNAGIYVQNTMHWTDWFRTTTGWRGDTVAATVNSMLQPANSGKDQMTIGSPKFTATFGPFYKTELFAGVGMGYHSNDARSSVITQVPGDPAMPQSAAPLLVRSRGGEVGIRTKFIPNLDSSISAFYIRQDSELFFDGDTGTTAAGLPSQRTGIEFTNDYRLADWFHIDADLALSRARFLGFDETQNAIYQSLAGFPQAQIGNAPGNFVYNAPWMVASAGITLGDKAGWFSSLRWRYISSRPLTEDGAFQSPPFNVINGTVGYRFDNGWRIQLDALNLLNSTTDQATYAYGSLLTSDTSTTGEKLLAMCFPTPKPSVAAFCQNGVMDYVMHPMEPLAVRLTLAGPIDKIDMPAMASELRRAIPEYRAPAANYDWTGFYVGARVNSSWTKTTASTINTVTGASVAPDGLTPSNWSGGVQVGYDYMMPSRVVLGVVGDVSSGGRKAVTITDASGISTNELNVFDSETVRARLGFAADNVLFYGTGGWAWSSNQYVRTQLTGDLNLASMGTAEATNKYLSGWTAGGGMAYAFAQNWNVFAEYRHTSYGSASVALPFSQLFTTSKTEVNAIDFGVNYEFDAGSAPVARERVFATQPSLLAYKAPSAGHVYNWTGFNFGIDGGYGWGNPGGTLTDAAGTPLAPYSYRAEGPLAGLFIGGDYQINRFVVGAEGDWQWANLTGNNQANSPVSLPGGTSPGFAINTTVKDYGSARGRLGVVAFDRFMLFGTAGWAWGNPSNAYASAGSAPSFTSAGYSSGWTAGAGIDYAITDSVFGRLEYRHTSLEAPKFADLASNFADTTSKVPVNDFRAGLVYKFRDIPFLRNF